MAGVNVRGISKTYTINKSSFHALKNVSLDIEDGSFTTIVGKSGCGKTTLLRILSGLEKQTDGQIQFVARRGKGDNLVRRIGINFQEPRLMPWLTVKENMAFPLLREKNKDKVEQVVKKYLQVMGLEKFKDAYPSQISGGMAQRTALGRTLCYDPDLILMDEPFAALDYFTRRNLQNEMVDLFQAHGKTIMFVTHNVEEAIYLGQNVVVLADGEVVKQLTVEHPYPRKESSPEFVDIKQEIIDTIINGKARI